MNVANMWCGGGGVRLPERSGGSIETAAGPAVPTAADSFVVQPLSCICQPASVNYLQSEDISTFRPICRVPARSHSYINSGGKVCSMGFYITLPAVLCQLS